MVDSQLYVTFEGPGITEEGISLDDLQKTLRHVQTAMRLMVQHLSGRTGRGRPPNWLQRESKLRLLRTSPGSLVAELGLSPSDGPSSPESYGQQAIDRIVGSEHVRSLPQSVADALSRIGTDISSEVTLVQLAGPLSGRYVEVWCREPEATKPAMRSPSAPRKEKALVYGWLKAVDWEKRTAKLYRYQGRPVHLLFTAEYEQPMLQLAMQYVEVRGQGHFNNYDQWQSVQVEEIRGARSCNEPFDVEAFLNDPHPKVFRSDEIVRASEPFDVDEFIRITREGRDT